MESTKERLKQEIDNFNEAELNQIAEFIEFIKFRSRSSEVSMVEVGNGEEETKESVLADLRQAWHEAMTGNTIPVSQIWEGLEND